MPKPMYVWSGSAWVSVATEVESLANFATQSYADNTPGIKMVVPTSVAVGSGTSSVATQGTVTFSGATSVALDGVFNSTYDNYRIVLSNFIAAASGNDLRLQGRVAGATQTAANYGFGGINISSTAVSYASGGAGLTTGGSIGFTETTLGNGVVVDIYCPNKAIETGWNYAQKRAATANGYFGWGAYQNTAQLTGFILTASGGGNISGNISVYGYKAG
jgi:hypothetical protein